MEWVLDGEGVATEKIDGSCCAIIGGVFYKRYDAKRGKTPPADAIPCCEPDPITGHWPHWVRVDENDKSNIWYVEAYRNADCPTEDGTYEAIGPHFRSNSYGLEKDVIEKHGIRILQGVPRDFGIKSYSLLEIRIVAVYTGQNIDASYFGLNPLDFSSLLD